LTKYGGHVMRDETVRTVKAPTYPSDWFRNNLVKPEISWPDNEHTLDALRGTIMDNIKNDRVNEPNLILSYVKHMMSTVIKDTLVEDWSSFNVRIGGKCSLIHPIDLLRQKTFAGPCVVGTVPADSM
jgi:hypothetical protein